MKPNQTTALIKRPHQQASSNRILYTFAASGFLLFLAILTMAFVINGMCERLFIRAMDTLGCRLVEQKSMNGHYIAKRQLSDLLFPVSCEVDYQVRQFACRNRYESDLCEMASSISKSDCDALILYTSASLGSAVVIWFAAAIALYKYKSPVQEQNINIMEVPEMPRP